MKTKIQLVLEHLETLNTSDIIHIHNQYCQNHNYSDDEIYWNDEDFFETFFPNNSYEVARATFYGDYNFSHEYVRFNWYGNLESLDSFSTSDFVESTEKIAEDIIENPSDYSHAIDLDDIEDFDDAPDTETE